MPTRVLVLLMTFELQIGGRRRRVHAERRADGYQVSVDGQLHVVDIVHVHGNEWSLLLRRPQGPARRSFRVGVTPQPGNGGFDVHVNGVLVTVTTLSGLGHRSRDASRRGAALGGPQRVAAPMPGKIVRVLVEPGQHVKPRQGLVVVEAMKMENELRAAREGRVRDVQVVEGQSVEAGTLLVLVE